MKRLRSLSHPGVVLGVIALIVALSGTAIALPGKDRVTKNDIRARAVAKSEIRANAVGTSEVRDNAVGGSEIADGSVRGAEVDEASLGKVPSAAQADSAATAANAGTVGGKTAGQLDTRWALIAENGTIERQTGGFTTVNCYQANANCYIDAGEDVRHNGISAQIAIANTDGSAILSAETGAAPCGATFVACAPPNTERNEVLVVAPRDSAGAVPGGVTPPAPADAARFYVFVTGSQG
jgi:hypothetical protein